jgi:hypothetical protein
MNDMMSISPLLLVKTCESRLFAGLNPNFAWPTMLHRQVPTWNFRLQTIHLKIGLPSGKHTKNYGKIHHVSWENSL